MSTHAPGPWRVHPVNDTVVVDAFGSEVAAIDGDYNSPDTWPTMEANARLIAAAPDLLDHARACEALLVKLCGEPPLLQPPGEREKQPTRFAAWYEIRALRAAIAEAEGRT